MTDPSRAPTPPRGLDAVDLHEQLAADARQDAALSALRRSVRALTVALAVTLVVAVAALAVAAQPTLHRPAPPPSVSLECPSCTCPACPSCTCSAPPPCPPCPVIDWRPRR